MRICNNNINHDAEIVYDSIYDIVCPICDLISEYKDLVAIELKENQDLRYRISRLEDTIKLMRLDEIDR